MVEFAICLPLLAILVFGTIDLGRVYVTWQHVKNAAREGAYLAASQPYHQYNVSGASPACTDDIWDRAIQESSSSPSDLTLTVSVTPAGGSTTNYVSGANGAKGSLVCGTPAGVTPAFGTSIKVTVQNNKFTLLTPLVQAMIGTISVKSSVTVVEQQ